MPNELPSSARQMLAIFSQYDVRKAELNSVNQQLLSRNHMQWDQEKRLLTKLDLRIIPVIAFFIFLSLLDQGNIFTAEFDRMQDDIALKGNQFNHCIMICIVTYCMFTVPSSLGLIKVSPSFWIPTIVSCWGVVMTTMGIIYGFSGLFWSRFFLGMFEAGMLPGASFVISTWYRRSELQVRQSLIMSVAVSLNAFGSLISWVISMMKGVGGMEGWRWIFVIEGSVSVVAGGFGYMLMFNYPESSELLTERERKIVQNRVLASEGWAAKEIDEDDTGTNFVIQEDDIFDYLKKYKWHGLEAALLDWQVFLHTLIYLAVSTASYSVSILLPKEMVTLGFDQEAIKLASIPVYVGASIISVLLAIVSDKVTARSPALILSFAMIIAGFVVVLISEQYNTKGSVAYSGLFLAYIGVQTAQPGAIAWLCNNTMCQAKRVFAISIQIGCGNLGGIVATYLYINGPMSTTAIHVIIIFMSVGGLLLVILLVFIYSKVNRQRGDYCELTGCEPLTNAELAFVGDKNPFFRYMN